MKMRNSKIDTMLLWKLWHNGTSADEICTQLGISHTRLLGLAKRFNLRDAEKIRRPRTGKPVIDPTPEELAQRAAVVRASWTPEERERRRLGGGRLPVEIKSFSFGLDYSFSSIDH